MLLIIHNLPHNIRYNDVKALIHSKCGLSELILDNLVPEGTGKKVTVGVAEEGDAAILVRKINGIYLSGQQLYVEDARRKKASEQPYCNTSNLVQEKLLQSNYQAPRQLSPSNQDNAVSHMMQTPMVPFINPMGMNSMYYVPPVQNSQFLGFGGQSQHSQQMNNQQMFAGQMDQPYAFDVEGNNPNFQASWTSDPGFNNEQSSFPSQEVPREQPRGRSPKGYNRPDRGFSARDRERGDYGSNENFRRTQQSRSPPRQRDHHINIWEGDSSAGNNYDRGQQRPFSDRSEVFPEKFGRNSKSGYVDPHAPPTRHTSSTHDRGSHLQGPSRGKNPRWEDTEAFQYSLRKEANSQQRNRQERPERMPPCNQQNRDNQPRGNWRERDVKAPPKRMRHQNPDYEEPRTKRFAAPRPDDRNKPIAKPRNDMKANLTNPSNKDTAMKIQNRTVTFRGQAASFLMKDMMANPKLQIAVEMIPLIKAALRQRIDVIMGGTSDVQRDDIVNLYRISFPKRLDRAFLNKVKRTNDENNLSKENQAKPLAHNRDGEPNVASSTNSRPAAMPKFVPEGKKPQPFVSGPEGQAPASTGRLPKYPEGSKKKHMETKKRNKEETIDPSIYALEPLLDKVLNEEVDVIVNMFVEELANPETEMEHQVKSHLTDEVIEELKWVFKLPTTKRLLDIKTNLLIRIFGHPKPPKRASLEAFLKPFGAVSLKKSDRKPLYVATCDTYDNYDRLCSLGEAVIDEISCTFKPMYIAGVPNKRKGMHRFRFGQPQYRNTQASEAVETTPAEVKVENKENDEEIAGNNVAKDIKKEADANESTGHAHIIKPENDSANIDSIKTEIDGNNINIVKKDNATGLVKNDIDSKNNDEKTDDVNDEIHNDNADLDENNFITDVNDLMADIDGEDDVEDAHHDVNFGEINLDDLADVDVRDLEDDDLEDY